MKWSKINAFKCKKGKFAFYFGPFLLKMKVSITPSRKGTAGAGIHP
jgi:hypothetical protein